MSLHWKMVAILMKQVKLLGVEDRGKKRASHSHSLSTEAKKQRKENWEVLQNFHDIFNILLAWLSKNADTWMNNKVAEPYSIEEVMKVVETVPGAEPGSDLLWFASELFCSEEKRRMFTVMKNDDFKLQYLIRNHEKSNKAIE
ncbi:hypothetical protein ACFX13_023272 [Malus domestica]